MTMKRVTFNFPSIYYEEIKVFFVAIGFRLLFYMLSLVVMAIFGEYQNGIHFSDFLDTWSRWDSAHYLNIAENGYYGAIENGEHLFLVFFPFYPWLIRTVSLVAGNYKLAGILVSCFAYGIGSVYFSKLMKMEYGREEAGNAALSLALFPFGFFLGAIHTEALFFAILAAFFYYLRQDKQGEMAFCGFLAALTKVQGMLLAFAVLAELLLNGEVKRWLSEKQWKKLAGRVVRAGILCLPMLAGVLIYLGINFAVEGNPFQFMYYQKNHWGNSLTPLWNTLSYITAHVKNEWYTSTGMSLWVPEFLLFFVYLFYIGYGIFKKIRPCYLFYLIVFFVLTYSSTWLISGGRYTLSALPIFILNGKLYTEHRKMGKILLFLSACLMMIYMVGFYQWKQIM